MIRLTIHDEVNMQIEGLLLNELIAIQKKFSYRIPGAFMLASVRTGNSDGRESLIDDEGITFFYLAEKIIDFIEKDLEYDLETEVDLVDNREPFEFPDLPFVDDTFLYEESGNTLRDHQTNGINAVIAQKKGFLEYGTSAGKTLCALGISKAFDPYLKSIVIVPSETLVKQTYEDYSKSSLNCGALRSKVKPDKREQFFKDHDHVILTSKLFLNCLDYVDGGRYALIWDEVHIAGEILLGAIRDQMRNCPVRVGLTGTLPSDKLKLNKVKCHIGGDVLDTVSPRELMDRNYAANVSISMVQTSDPQVEHFSHTSDLWSWEMEERYLGTNENRALAIADYIKTLDDRNTLILCHPCMGILLSKHFNDRMILDDVPVDVRKEWFDDFDTFESGVILCASWATSATGISVNRIHRLISIDVGKNNTFIKQGIGRGMRKSENNNVEVVDISANTRYSERHRKERIKIYKHEKFDYTIEENYIYV